MFRTNLNILITVLATLGVYTLVANIIPQVQSAVPEELVLSADTSPEELAAIGGEVYAGIGGCTACHGLGTRAPDLLGVAGTVCATRKPELSCKDYLWESLVDPTAYLVEGFQPIMLDQSRTLTQPQLWALVAFLESQGGEVTVTSEDFGPAVEAQAAVAATGAEETAGGEPGAAAEPGEIDVPALIEATGCLACHAMGGVGGAVGPPFEELREKDVEYIRRGIVDPNADTAAGFEAFAGTMPPTFGSMLSPAELEALIRYLKGGDGG